MENKEIIEQLKQRRNADDGHDEFWNTVLAIFKDINSNIAKAEVTGHQMSTQEFIDYHRASCDKLVEITKSKNHDYAGFSDADPFANFKLVEKMGVATVEQGILTRMLDKVSRVNSFLKQGMLNVSDEKIEDTLLDLANYSIILSGYMKSKKNK